VNSYLRLGFVVSLATYDIKRESIKGLVNVALRMRFRTAPHPVAYLHTDHVAFRRYIHSVFDVGELDLLNTNHFMMILLPLD
jgi:hypothetical protein